MSQFITLVLIIGLLARAATASLESDEFTQFLLNIYCDQAKNCGECTSGDYADSCAWCQSSKSCVQSSFFKCFMGGKIYEKKNCPKEIQKGFEFDEEHARTIMFPISSAAYSPNAGCSMKKSIDDFKLKRQITAKCSPTRDDLCSVFSGISPKHKAIIVGFRGSESATQIFYEVIDTVFKSKIQLAGGGSVSTYFFDGYKALIDNGFSSDLIELITTHRNDDYELWISGHSLGGAMAAIAAHIFAYNKVFPASRIKLVTFGQPRVGDEYFAQMQDELLPYHYRVTHKNDMVPHVPPKNFEDYRHERYEVWYDNDMEPNSTYAVCKTPESISCSNDNTFNFSIDDHQFYFGVQVSQAGLDGCES